MHSIVSISIYVRYFVVFFLRCPTCKLYICTENQDQASFAFLFHRSFLSSWACLSLFCITECFLFYIHTQYIHIHSRGPYLAIKGNLSLYSNMDGPKYYTKWNKPEGKYYDFIYVKSKKLIKWTNITKQKQSSIKRNKQTIARE